MPVVNEGDLVDIENCDTAPVPTREVSPVVPVMARQRRVSGTVLLRVLIDENGKPAKVELLRDVTPHVGLGALERAGARAVAVEAGDEERREGEDLARGPGALQELEDILSAWPGPPRAAGDGAGKGRPLPPRYFVLRNSSMMLSENHETKTPSM